MKLGVRGPVAFSTPTPVVQRTMFWGSKQSLDSLEFISHSVKNFNLSNFKLQRHSFLFSYQEKWKKKKSVDAATLLLLMSVKVWLNHEFGGFWFQGETILSSIFVKLGKQIPFHVYIHLMSFSCLCHATHFAS